MTTDELASTLPPRRWSRLARGRAKTGGAAGATCDLCAATIDDRHAHLFDLYSRGIRCVCDPCAVLFDRREAGGERYRRIPRDPLLIEDFALDDARWEHLAVPVGLAYFVRTGDAARVVAYYPGALGATESRLGLDAWDALEADNPILRELEPEVVALLVRRVRGAPQHFLAPIDACFRLVAIVRTRWKGLSGGDEAWREIDAFFADLEARSRRVARRGDPRRGGALGRRQLAKGGSTVAVE